MVGLEDDPASYWVLVTLRGRAVKLREGNFQVPIFDFGGGLSDY